MTEEHRLFIEEVKDGLKAIGKSRKWLSITTGISLATLNGILAKKSKRPVTTSNKNLIRQVLASPDINPKATYEDYMIIRKLAKEYGLEVDEFLIAKALDRLPEKKATRYPDITPETALVSEPDKEGK